MPKVKKLSQRALKERKKLLREDATFRETEREADAEARQIARQDKEKRNAEQATNSLLRQKARQDKDRRDAEQATNSLLRQKARQDKERRDAEQTADTLSRQKVRQDRERRDAEQTADTLSRQKVRQNKERRDAEQTSNTIEHKKRRRIDDAISEFQTQIKFGPDSICMSCDGLFFLTSMKPLNRTSIVKKFGERFCEIALRPKVKDIPEYLCSTCHSYVRKGNTPRLCFSNGFQFPVIPEELTGLTQLEERLVAARIPFMAITQLGVDRQCGLRGNVVNVVNPVNETAKILPRRFDDTSVIQVMLMRKIEYQRPYLFESIRPKKVFEAAKYLSSTELYKEEGIVFSDDWLELDFQGLEKLEKESSLSDKNREAISERHEDQLNPGGQQTLLLDFDALENNDVIQFAPGEGQRPISLLMDSNAEALSFPSIYGGAARKMTLSSLTRTDIAKSDARNKDRRCAVPNKLLYSFKLVQTHQIANQVQLYLRKKKGSARPTAGNLLNSEFVENFVQHDDGYRLLKNIRSSPAYWQDKQKVLMAMIRQLGIPTLFITLSAAEVKWPELIVILKKVLENINITEEEAGKLTWQEKAGLIRRDPITCSRYFDYRLRQCTKYLLMHSKGIFEIHPVLDSFTRIEFQHRGSPHMHGLFWLKGAPKFDEENPESIQDCQNFIDQYISCASDMEGVIHQGHKHTRCCQVKFRGNTKCRFGMPYPPMRETTILLPFPIEFPAVLKSNATKNLLAVKDQLQYLLDKKIELTFEEFLDFMGLNVSEYIMAVRSSIHRPTVFLKRNIQEAFTNAYNTTLATNWKANMDIQFILDPYACCKYVAAYVSKSCRGMSELLNKVVEEAREGNISCKEKLKNISKVFLNGSEISAQEAAYTILGIPLSRCSRDCIYINTSLPSERVVLTKSARDLKNLPEASTDVTIEGLLDHYAQRPDELQECCLADFAAFWTYSGKPVSKKGTVTDDDLDDVEADDCSDDEMETPASFKLRNGKGYIRKRKTPRIIRMRKYGELEDPENFYRENVMLYFPWRDEQKDILDLNSKHLYKTNLAEIEQSKSKYEQRLDLDSMEMGLKQIISEEHEEEFLIDDEFQVIHNEDFVADFGLELGDAEQDKVKILKMPSMMNNGSYDKLIESLNRKQRMYHDHCVKNFALPKNPFHEFVSGGAGVGKSMLITAISQSVMRIAVKQIGDDPSRLKVLLCASTGVAAYNIGGFTLHQAFGLPFSQFGGVMPRLSENTRNKLAKEFRSLDLIVIDEISMTSYDQLQQIDERLRQIFKTEAVFGGRSVLAVGDFNQLKPVMASWIFSEPKLGQQILGGNQLWPMFKYFQLTECMRQKDDVAFAEALNRLADGECTDEDVVMFQSREVNRNNLRSPNSAVQLMFSNAAVSSYNSKVLTQLQTEGIVSNANDRVQGRGKKEHHEAIRNAAKNLPLQKTQNLPLSLDFKISAKYMMTVNVDTSDGLVNGSIGILRKITYGKTAGGEKVPIKVWMEFSKNVGEKLKAKTKLKGNLVPIAMESRCIHKWPGKNLEVIRHQFPFVPAEAITIHKSQGSTFPEVVVSVQYTTSTGSLRTIPRRALYVGLSRCSSLKGLYIDGEFYPPERPEVGDKVVLEIEKLRDRPIKFEDSENESKIVLKIAAQSLQVNPPQSSVIKIGRVVQKQAQVRISLADPVVAVVGGNNRYKSDIDSTKPMGWFTDIVVDSFIHLVKNKTTEEEGISIFNFGSLFLNQLKASDTWETMIWVNNIRSTLMVFPRCCNQHWTVIVADWRTKCITHYDSLNLFQNYLEDLTIVEEFLKISYGRRFGCQGQQWIKDCYVLPDLNKQTNGWDCGPYVCAFVKCLSEDRCIDFTEADMLGFRLLVQQSLIKSSL